MNLSEYKMKLKLLNNIKNVIVEVFLNFIFGGV